jgi:uncharacterized protein YfaP (DUF2135 family)
MIQVLLVLVLAQAKMAPPRLDGVPIGSGVVIPKVTLTKPTGGWSVGRMLKVEGAVNDATIDPVVVSINGDRYLMRTVGGAFSREFPAAAGKNVVTVLATNKAGTGRAQASAYAQIPAVPLKVILTSDTDGVYTDLHVYEPSDGSEVAGQLDSRQMRHVFWADTVSPSGGTFFLNEQQGDFDQPGYGPYLYVHRAPPKGTYLIAANYWPSGDKAHTIATLNLSLFEGTPNEMKKRVTIPLATPGSTRVLAWVHMLGEGRALMYVPTTDPKPSDAHWPVNLDAAAKALQGESEMGGD